MPHRLWSHQTKAKATRVLLLRCFWVAHLFISVIHVNRIAPYHKLKCIPFSSFRPWPSTCLNSSHCPQYPILRSMFQCYVCFVYIYIVSFLSSWFASSLALCKQFSFFFLCFLRLILFAILCVCLSCCVCAVRLLANFNIIISSVLLYYRVCAFSVWKRISIIYNNNPMRRLLTGWMPCTHTFFFFLHKQIRHHAIFLLLALQSVCCFAQHFLNLLLFRIQSTSKNKQRGTKVFKSI